VPDLSARSFGSFIHAAADVTIAAAAAGIALAILYPLTLCAAGIKGLLRTVGLRTSASEGFIGQKCSQQGRRAEERAERKLIG
jgi:hypothetical protein